MLAPLASTSRVELRTPFAWFPPHIVCQQVRDLARVLQHALSGLTAPANDLLHRLNGTLTRLCKDSFTTGAVAAKEAIIRAFPSLAFSPTVVAPSLTVFATSLARVSAWLIVWWTP